MTIVPVTHDQLVPPSGFETDRYRLSNSAYQVQFEGRADGGPSALVTSRIMLQRHYYRENNELAEFSTL